MSAKNNSPNTSEREIVISRTVDAPRERVWEALTNPKQVVQWWGPNGFTNTNEKMEVKVGGEWKFVMHGPDGTNYPNYVKYDKVVKPELLSYEHGGGNEGHDDATFHQTITLEEQKGKTLVTLHLLFKTKEARDLVVKKYGAIEGGKQTLSKLDMHLAMQKPPTLTLTHTYNVSREKMWQAWTDEEKVSKWFAPAGFTIPRCEIDAKVGGIFSLDMKGPDGAIYPMTAVYHKVDKPNELAYLARPSGPGGKGAELVQTVRLEDVGGKTKLTWKSYVLSVDKGAEQMIEGMEIGCNMSLDSLGRELGSSGNEGQDFVISRVLKAPLNLVWKAYSETERIKQWLAPKGFEMVQAKHDFRVGGMLHYAQKGPDGKVMWGKFVYKEIVPQKKLVVVNSFSDEKGGLTRHPMSPTWPREMLATTTFEEENGQTRVTIHWKPLNATPEEAKTFESSFGGMTAGWTGTFEYLEAYLAKEQKK